MFEMKCVCNLIAHFVKSVNNSKFYILLDNEVKNILKLKPLFNQDILLSIHTKNSKF